MLWYDFIFFFKNYHPTYKYPGRIRSHDQSPRWQAGTIPLDHAVWSNFISNDFGWHTWKVNRDELIDHNFSTNQLEGDFNLTCHPHSWETTSGKFGNNKNTLIHICLCKGDMQNESFTQNYDGYLITTPRYTNRIVLLLTRSQSYDHELQRQSCENLQRN
jgi:hypothetical protein